MSADTTAQLRQKLEKTIKAITIASERNGYHEPYQKASMEVILNHIADYISQLELPKQEVKGWNGEVGPNNGAWNSGYNVALDEMKAKLKQQAEKLRA